LQRQRAALISVFSNTALIVFKVIAGILMGSVAVISEALHSGIDLIASIVAYFSIRKANEPADREHPFGHGKFENLSGAFEAILIFFAAGLIIFEAVKKLAHPTPLEKIGWGIGVMVVSSIVNIIVSTALFRIARKEHSIALEADAMHLSTDVFTSAGVALGLLAIQFTHLNFLDPLIAMVVALMILKAAWDLTAKSIRDLADVSLPDHEIRAIKNILARYPGILSYHQMRTRRSGGQREIDIHVQMKNQLQLEKAHELCTRAENDIKCKYPGSYVIIHMEPKIIKTGVPGKPDHEKDD
jgi:cation diffusion facilitator family transporter